MDEATIIKTQSAAAKHVGRCARTIRRWERAGLISRTEAGYYDQTQLEKVDPRQQPRFVKVTDSELRELREELTKARAQVKAVEDRLSEFMLPAARGGKRKTGE